MNFSTYWEFFEYVYAALYLASTVLFLLRVLIVANFLTQSQAYAQTTIAKNSNADTSTCLIHLKYKINRLFVDH